MAWLQDPARTQPELDNYWQNKRANQLFKSGPQPMSVDPQGSISPLATIDEVAANEQAVNAARAVGTAAGGAQSKLPGMAMEVDSTLQFIDELRNHPGREMATGKSSLLNFAATPGSDTGDFLQKLETAEGKSFAIAYETLKGGGTITEIETAMATKALANLNASQSEEQFLKALDEFEVAVLRGYRKLQATAGQPQTAGQPPADDYEARVSRALNQ
jgi:hypothetical protein